MFAASILLTAAACEGSDRPPPPSVAAAPIAVPLPGPPPFMAPVDLPPIVDGENAKVALAQHRAALVIARARAQKSREWYLDLRRRLARGGKP